MHIPVYEKPEEEEQQEKLQAIYNLKIQFTMVVRSTVEGKYL